MEALSFPHIRVEGGPRDRGEQYGRLARERIHRSVAAYREVFRKLAGMEWAAAQERARVYANVTAELRPRMMQEVEGIARGADLDVLDIVAINARTEFIIGARVRHGERGVTTGQAECTAIAAAPPRTRAGEAVIGQNWDYLRHTAETLVVLDVRQEDGPNFVTVVEAGLLAKMGMNSCGLALVTNGLATSHDIDRAGLPYHMLLREVLESASIGEAVAMLRELPKGSSANYLLADPGGAVVGAEAWAGDGGHVAVLMPDDGVIVHTNHFLVAPVGTEAVAFELATTSVARRERALVLLNGAERPLGDADIARVLGDHENHPEGVCTHEAEWLSPVERYPTIASLVMKPDSRVMMLAEGNPCGTRHRALDSSSLM